MVQGRLRADYAVMAILRKLADLKYCIVRFAASFHRCAESAKRKMRVGGDMRWLYEMEYENSTYVRDSLYVIARYVAGIEQAIKSGNRAALARLTEELKSVLANFESNAGTNLPDELVLRLAELRDALESGVQRAVA